MSDLHEMLPEWVIDELRRPVPTRAERKSRVMELVHALPATPRRRRRWWREPSRPGALGAGAALALAACTVLGVMASGLGRGMLPAPVDGARTVVIGDTVVGTLHDTLRLVRFVLHAPAASRVSLASATRDVPARAVPLARAAGGTWSTVLPLAPGRYTFRVVVDDTRHADVPVVVGARPAAATPSARPGGDST